MSDKRAPMAPTARRIHPMVWISIPLTVALTAQTRTAPTAMRRRLTPIPIVCLLSMTRRGTLRICRENAETRCRDTGHAEPQERRAYLYGLTPERGLKSLEEAHEFLGH